jgi:hypothetical protein
MAESQREELLGWATGRLIAHDALAPGVIRRLLSNGPARRQAVFTLLAVEAASEPVEQEAVADRSAPLHRAEIIRDGGARDVLAEALGHVPPTGLRGALERVGHSLLPEPRLYQRLIEIYSNPIHRAAADALRYVGRITGSMLDVLEVLPVTLVHPNMLKNLRGVNHARSFLGAVQFAKFVNSNCTDEAILYSLNHAQADKDLEDVLARSVRRADRQLGVPLAADDDVRPLVLARDLCFASRKFRNCLSREHKIVGALLGRAAYAIFREEVVIEFVHLSTGNWLLVDTHAHGNGAVPKELEQAARAKCRESGIACLPEARERSGRFGRFADRYDPVCLNIAA